MKYFIIFTSILCLFVECVRENLYPPNEGRKIVLNGLLTTDTLLNIKITKSDYILGTALEPIFYDQDSVEVYIYQNKMRIDSLHHVSPSLFNTLGVLNLGNYWSRSVSAVPGQEYKVVMKLSGLPEATAITTIPELVKIDNLDTSRVTLALGSFYENNVGMKFAIEFSDPRNRPNYYLLRIYSVTYYDPLDNFQRLPSFNSLQFACQDPIVEEKLNSVNGLEVIAFTDKLFNGQTHRLDVIVKGESIGKPFTQHPQSTYIDHRKAVYIKLYSIQEEYFRYIQTLNLYSKNYSNPLAEPVLMNSNVTGGYGIFSGAAVSSDSVVFKY